MPVATEDLIRRFQRGQPGAFDALFERYKDYVYRVAFFITRNSGDAEEATQETFLDVLHALARFKIEGPARFETWLYRITVNRCRSMFRRKRPPSADWDELADELVAGVNGDPNHSAVKRETRELVWQAVNNLPDAQREVIALRYLCDLSYDEIAHILGINAGTVKSRLFYAHQALQGVLSPVASELVRTGVEL
jgi:RNA polymerase sigma-70 factor (ECF subfamily)